MEKDKEMQELRDKSKNQMTPELKESNQKLRDRITSYNDKNEKEFQRTVKTVKHILKSKKLVLPRDWQKVFLEWYAEKYTDEIYTLSWDDLTEKMKDESIIIEWAESYTKELIPEKIEVEAYTNLPHILCILDDLGILDLIEEKFKTKNYSGTAMQTDKAKLIATILGIEDAQKIRYAIKNSDYLSEKAKVKAVKTLKSLGLEPSKFID